MAIIKEHELKKAKTKNLKKCMTTPFYSCRSRLSLFVLFKSIP